MANEPKKAVWDDCLDEPIPPGEEIEHMLEITPEMRKSMALKRDEDARQQAEVHKMFKDLIIR